MFDLILAMSFAILFAIVAAVLLWSLKRPGSRYRLKKDFGLTDKEIDERFGNTIVTEENLNSLRTEKQKKDRDRVA